MEKFTLKLLIGEYQSRVMKYHVVYRNMTFDGDACYVLVGIRRAGKSYLLYQDIQSRIADGSLRHDGFIFLNFEDERLQGMTASELGMILDCYHEMYDQTEPLVYLDEVQNIVGWEHFARRLSDNGYRVMITGSNAKMLSREVAATLGGRYIPRDVCPFDFSEYLSYEGVTIDKNWFFRPETRTKVRRLFDHYFQNGGFAGGFQLVDQREYVNSLYQKILVGDIVERNKVRSPRVFRLLARKLADSVMQPTSLNRLKHIIDSTGDSISMSVLKDYLEYMEDAYLIFNLPNLLSSSTDRETIKKRYFADNGILNLFMVNGETKLLENLVALQLFRHYHDDGEEPRVFYYNKGIEVDFVVPEQKQAIQVCYNLHQDANTYEREVGAMARFLNAFSEYQGMILTYDEAEHLHMGNRDIEVIPVWQWLLTQS